MSNEILIGKVIENALNNNFKIKKITKEEWNSNLKTTSELKVDEDHIQVYLSEYTAEQCLENNCLEKAPVCIPKSMFPEEYLYLFCD